MSGRWKRHLLGGGVVVAALKAAHIFATDDWEDVISYPTRRWKKVLRNWSGQPKPHIPHVVVLGTGWGALSFLRHVDPEDMRVTIVSPRSFFFYTPLLAGTAIGTVGHQSIIEPIRWYCNNDMCGSGVSYVQAECSHISVEEKRVLCTSFAQSSDNGSPFSIPYDHLIIAVGAQPATFNIPGVTENAHFMKEIADSMDVQNNILQNLEKANTILVSSGDEGFQNEEAAEIDRLLHWVIVGGGPTGVELVAEITDFIQRDVAKYFPNLHNRCRVTLLEAAGKLLSTFDASTSCYAKDVLESRGALVLTDTMVTRIDATSVSIKTRHEISGLAGALSKLPATLLEQSCPRSDRKSIEVKDIDFVEDEIRSGVVVWAGGITMRPFVKDFVQTQLPQEHQWSRWGILVDGYFQVRGAEDKGLWAIGDCAVVEDCAPTAQAAAQQGAFLGRLFRDNLKYFSSTDLNGATKLPIPPNLSPFKYEDKGSLAYVGGNRAVADLKNIIWVGHPYFSKTTTTVKNENSFSVTDNRISVKGRSAFAIWRSIYFSKLMSMRNVCQVCLDWCKTVIFGRDIASMSRQKVVTVVDGDVKK